MSAIEAVTRPFGDPYETLETTGYLLCTLAIGVIIGMEIVATGAYTPSRFGPEPAWLGIAKAIRLWMMALASTSIALALATDWYKTGDTE